jgi:RNA-directed DNA polymerase
MGDEYKNTMNKQQITAELFQAYYDARENKRNRPDAIRFEMNYERNLFALAEEIMSGQYRPGPSICFVVDKPVKREVFAAEFRDRVVHHFVFNRLNPVFDPRFINDAYSCRLGKGTSYGIRRLDHFIRSCSENYQKDCYILKLDIKGYFMSINRQILYDKVERTVKCVYERERELPRLLIYLILSVRSYFMTRPLIVLLEDKRRTGLDCRRQKVYFLPVSAAACPLAIWLPSFLAIFI